MVESVEVRHLYGSKAKQPRQLGTYTSRHFVINPSTANLLPGESFTFIFVQNGATACTLNYPGTMHGGMTLSSTLSSVNVQEFVVSNNGTDAYAKAAPVSSTGGTP